MSQLNIVAIFDLKPEHQDACLPEFEKLITGSRQEAGCVRYELNQDVKNTNIYVVSETWQSQQAIDFHNTQPHFTNFIKFVESRVNNIQIHVMKQVM